MESDKRQLLDNWLDQALKQRGAVEPRPGLEGRILATLHAESNWMPAQTWRWRVAWFGLAAAGLIGATLFLAWRSSTGPHRTTEVQLPTKQDARPNPRPAELATAQPRRSPKRASTPRVIARVLPRVPKLPQFPSPQPLSEQEEMLVRYVSQFPREAVLMARAQTALSKQESIEGQPMNPSFDFPESPKEQNQ